MYKIFLFISFGFSYNPIDLWLDRNAEILNHDFKSVTFNIRIESQYFEAGNDSMVFGSISVGKNNQFRLEMGYRTVVSDGEIWKSYDTRTNQIFLQKPDRKIEKSFLSWTKINKIKALPVKHKEDGGYQVKLLGKGNDVRIYFDRKFGILDSVIIVQHDLRSKISKINLNKESRINLVIGNQDSEIFDIR